MTTTTKIGAALASPAFGTGTAKVTWTPTSGTNWTGTSTDAAFVNKVSVFLWGSAADKTGEDPYKTMNSWYTTNKAAIDSASLAASTQVAAWALYLDLTLNIESTSMVPPPSMDKARTATDEVCSATTNTSITYAAGVNAAVGDWGDNFAIGVVNKTSSARTPLLRWGNQVSTAATSSAAGVAGTVWKQYTWTDNATITDYSALTATQITTLQGTADSAPFTVADADNFGAEIAATGTELTCDTTKWASATACDGVTRWGLGTTTEFTSTTSLGSKRAWLWLADNVVSSSVFGIEKSDVINFTFYQGTAYSPGAATPAACALPITASGQRLSQAFNNWGVATFTYAGGASATLLGASAVIAALVSFF